MTQFYATSSGLFHPLGAIPDRGGVNFAVFCRNATAVQLLLFDRADAPQPAQVIDLDSALNKTYFIWHVYVKGLQPGAHYAYRVDGPQDLHGTDPSGVKHPGTFAGVAEKVPYLKEQGVTTVELMRPGPPGHAREYRVYETARLKEQRHARDTAASRSSIATWKSNCHEFSKAAQRQF